MSIILLFAGPLPEMVFLVEFWWALPWPLRGGPGCPRRARSRRTMSRVNQSVLRTAPVTDGFIDAARRSATDAATPYEAGRSTWPRDALEAGPRGSEWLLLGTRRTFPAVTAMLGRCSRATLYKRFHGFTDGRAHAASTVSDPSEDAYGAWRAGRCVGMATLAVNEEGYGEIGVLVEDAWQRRGAGAALVTALVGLARELGLPGLVADVLADNYFILP